MIYFKISNLIKASGKSYRDLAQETRLSYATIAKLAHAKTQKEYDIGMSVLDKLCYFFKKKPGDLLSYKKR